MPNPVELQFINAIKEGNITVVSNMLNFQDPEILLAIQIPPNNNTPLIQAVVNNDTVIVDLLLEQSPKNLLHKNNTGKTALSIAQNNPEIFSKILTQLVNRGFDLTTLPEEDRYLIASNLDRRDIISEEVFNKLPLAITSLAGQQAQDISLEQIKARHHNPVYVPETSTEKLRGRFRKKDAPAQSDKTKNRILLKEGSPDNPSAIDILKSVTYCEHPDDVKRVHAMYDTLAGYKNNDINLLLNALALKALDKELSIYVADGNNIKSLTKNYDDAHTGGIYFADNILFSQMHAPKKAARTFLHEATHYLLDERLPETQKGGLPFDNTREGKAAGREFNRAMRAVDVDNREESTNFNKKHVSGRIKAAVESYTCHHDQQSEYAADTSAILAKLEQLQGRGEEKQSKAAQIRAETDPLLKFYEKHTHPKLQRFIKDHPKKGFVSNLPDLTVGQGKAK